MSIMGQHDDSAEGKRTPKPPMDLEGEGVYKEHRIHVRQLPYSGLWIAAIYHFGARDSGVHQIKGEYPTKAEAVEAAKRYIDRVEETGRPE